MAKLDFMDNWNRKLFCLFFTTARLWTEYKEDYYLSKVEETFEIKLKKNLFSKAILKEIFVAKIGDLQHDYFTWTDAGMNYADFLKFMEKLYGKKLQWKGEDTKMIIMLFRNIWFNEEE